MAVYFFEQIALGSKTHMSIEQAKEVLKIEAEGILALLDQIGPDFDKAIDLIMACPSRVILAQYGHRFFFSASC